MIKKAPLTTYTFLDRGLWDKIAYFNEFYNSFYFVTIIIKHSVELFYFKKI